MNQLETLLNSLIKMGWKPWGKLVNTILYIHFKSMLVCLNAINEPKRQIRQDSLRELVSLESGLWQFVCENKLLSDKVDMGDYRENSYGFQDRVHDKDGFYWMMRCARIPEEELGKFLIDNIKVKWLKSEQSKR